MTTVSMPARCAVAVVWGEHLISQVYPAAVPVEVFLDNIVELLSDDLRRRGAMALDHGIAYELQRANGTRLDVTKSLDELGVEDGSTLILAPAQSGESFEPQYESLSTGLARISKSLFAPVTADTAVTTALAIVGMSVLTTLVLAVRLRAHTDSWTAAAVTVAFGGALVFGAFAVRRWWPDRHRLCDALSWLAIPLLGCGFAAAAPGGIGGAHLFVAMLTAAVLTYALVASTGRNIAAGTAIVTLCAVGCLLAAARMWRPVPAQSLGMCTLVGLLILVTAAPAIALRIAGIRPPHFGSITGRDLFRRAAGMPVDAVGPVIEEIGSDEDLDDTPRGAVIADAARRANSALTGICAAAAVVLPVATWNTLMPGRPRSTAAVILALLFAVVFISRGRAFADRRQAIALVCGAAAAVCIGVVRYVLSAPVGAFAPVLFGTILLVGLAGAGLAAAMIVPTTRFTPMVRMLAEWMELAAIVVALPTAAWIGGLFAWVRMR